MVIDMAVYALDELGWVPIGHETMACPVITLMMVFFKIRQILSSRLSEVKNVAMFQHI